MTQANAKNINRTTAIIIVVVLVIAGSMLGFWIGKRSVGTRVSEVVRNITEGWELYKSGDHGFSFRHPADLKVVYANGVYTISQKDDAVMAMRVQSSRIVTAQDPLTAIQISIPLDKRNFIIFSTSSSSDEKEMFYAIASTIMIGK